MPLVLLVLLVPLVLLVLLVLFGALVLADECHRPARPFLVDGLILAAASPPTLQRSAKGSSVPIPGFSTDLIDLTGLSKESAPASGLLLPRWRAGACLSPAQC